MTGEPDYDLKTLGVEPEELDGFTLEDLTDYLDEGRTPTNPAIEESAGCRLALDALERLRALTPELLAADVAAEPATDEGWVQGILAGIALDARAGRRIPLTEEVPGLDLGITEGAIRGLIRAAETAVPGVLVGRCFIDGDVEEFGVPVRIRLEIGVAFGTSIPASVELLRTEIAARLRTHTGLNVTGIDISVRDVSAPIVVAGGEPARPEPAGAEPARENHSLDIKPEENR
ncbi:Asp23/Gls24 family envelope stress response protein [Mycetocola sp. JXN-3]|uniref:Asp23/Gls24 family envelope stress response protein n=1 Tax=Mycetocola sp. JXN-3 TaxID=2116510 RepID=UPI00165D2A39|nr:Asp23/Gls24 family envelope stress response protein [Mycetocola sp. JXN-3]